MPRSSEIIISDTSCLIVLFKIDELELLKRTGELAYVISAIKKEFGKRLPEWIHIKSKTIRHIKHVKISS